MIRVIFLGFGNVNQHICNALYKSNEVSIVQIYNRNKIATPLENIQIETISNISNLEDADVYIIGIPDDAISEFSKKIPIKNKLVVHTSGAVAMNVLYDGNRKGVFYPLQTFSKNRALNFKEIPICIEAENTSDLDILNNLGKLISDSVVKISSEERLKLHLAAVFVNNFVNYLYSVGDTILTENNISFNLLKPLILETAKKIETLSPADAQTGPAKRSDLKTIEKHLHLLDDSPFKNLYSTFTEALKTPK